MFQIKRLVCVAMLMMSPLVLAHGHDDDHIMFQDARVRAMPPGSPNSAAYLTIHNPTHQDRRLIAASSPAAKVVELHEHIMSGGVMSMQQVKDGVLIPAEETVRFQPGGYHLMLLGLKAPLVPGEQVSFELMFDDGSMQHVSAPILMPDEMTMSSSSTEHSH